MSVSVPWLVQCTTIQEKLSWSGQNIEFSCDIKRSFSQWGTQKVEILIYIFVTLYFLLL